MTTRASELSHQLVTTSPQYELYRYARKTILNWYLVAFLGEDRLIRSVYGVVYQQNKNNYLLTGCFSLIYLYETVEWVGCHIGQLKLQLLFAV